MPANEQQMRENEQAVADAERPISFVPENRSVRSNEKTVAFFFICLLLCISALCAGLPNTESYGAKNVAEDYDRGDTAWVIVASALGTVVYNIKNQTVSKYSYMQCSS